MPEPLRHHATLKPLHRPFGADRFGVLAERFARFFGTPGFIIAQSVVVTAWIALNAAAASQAWDPYPFILLNLAFSTQAAYAAPLILLAQTRQADRDKAMTEADARHREEISEAHTRVLSENHRLIQEVERLTERTYELAGKGRMS